MVHSKTDLDAVTKFNYLLSSLTGDARKAVDSHEVTNQGYKLAIEVLTKKYSDPEAAQRILVRLLLDMPSPRLVKLDLEKFIESFESLEYKLGLLKITPGPSDWLLSEHLIRKLPTNVINFICDKCNDLYPSVKQILEYLTLYVKRFDLMEKPSINVNRESTNYESVKSSYKTNNNVKYISAPHKTKSANIHSMVEKFSW